MSVTPQEVAKAVQDAEALLRRGDLAAAYAAADKAVAAGAEHPFLLKVQALWLHANGQYQDALRTFHHARTLAPGDPSILNGIAGCVAAMGGYEAALKVVGASLEIAPQSSSTHHLRGWILEETQDLAAAEQAYERAVALDKRHVQALAGVASLAARRGDFATARRRAADALALEPNQPVASIALAAAEVAEGDQSAAETRLRGVLDRAQLPSRVRAMAWGVLGDALEAQGRGPEAAAARRSRDEELKAGGPGR